MLTSKTFSFAFFFLPILRQRNVLFPKLLGTEVPQLVFFSSVLQKSWKSCSLLRWEMRRWDILWLFPKSAAQNGRTTHVALFPPLFTSPCLGSWNRQITFLKIVIYSFRVFFFFLSFNTSFKLYTGRKQFSQVFLKPHRILSIRK